MCNPGTPNTQAASGVSYFPLAVVMTLQPQRAARRSRLIADLVEEIDNEKRESEAELRAELAAIRRFQVPSRRSAQCWLCRLAHHGTTEVSPSCPDFREFRENNG